MPRHTIRLNSQWLPPDAPRHPPPASYLRLPATDRYRNSLNPPPFVLQRQFHAPTGMTAQTTVQVRLDVVAATPTVTFNGQSVLMHSHQPAQDSSGQSTFWFPVTPWLRPFNLLLITLNPDPSATSERPPTLVGVGLVIDDPSTSD
ncbi:MAG: hypothetical protein ACKO2P_11835 [Planctomycetota bacterium]